MDSMQGSNVMQITISSQQWLIPNTVRSGVNLVWTGGRGSRFKNWRSWVL